MMLLHVPLSFKIQMHKYVVETCPLDGMESAIIPHLDPILFAIHYKKSGKKDVGGTLSCTSDLQAAAFAGLRLASSFGWHISMHIFSKDCQ